MKAKLLVIGFLVLLVTLVTGCGGAHRYDGRLVAVDSLMKSDPDSALALVEAVSPDSLATDGDRAYRDLLLTQARYKCYIKATSDSDINRALDYYLHHSNDREKLTRAYIYKGAVMEELNHPDSAMYYYKTAEATADPDDYANLGYVTLRIADLYRMNYADSEICFDKYQSALHYLRLNNNLYLQQNCLYNMAVCASVTNTENPRKYLYQALDIANELNDSFGLYTCKEYLSRTLIIRESDSEEAKTVAYDCLENFSSFINYDLIMDLAHIYANKHLNDSSQFFLNFLEKDSLMKNEQLKLRYYWVLSIMAQNDGDTIKSNYYSNLKSLISDSIDNSDAKSHIHRIEIDKNHQQIDIKNRRINNLGWVAIVLIFALVAAILLYLIHLYRYHCRMKSVINEINHNHINEHQGLIKQLDEKDGVIGVFVHNLVNLMQTSIDTSQHDSPKVMRNRIATTITSVVNDDFWQELRCFLNKKYYNLIEDIAKNPKITDIDLKFIELSCCGFNYIELAVTLELSPNYISKKRKSIAKKLGTKMTLEEYLNNEISKRIEII